MKKAIALFAISLLCMALTACSGAGPTATVERFAEALNNRDVNAVVECCDSSTANVAKSFIDVGDGLLELSGSDAKLDDIASMLVPEVSEFLSQEGQDVTCNISVENLQEEISNGKTRVTGTWIIEISSNGDVHRQEYPLDLLMVQENKEWKIDFSNLAAHAFTELLGM